MGNTLHELKIGSRKSVTRGVIECLVFLTRDGRHFCVAQPRGGFSQRLKYRLQIECRAANNLEHIGRGGLLLQRFTELVEQPRVLDGDDCLRSEVPDEFDLLFGKCTDFLPEDNHRPDKLAILEQWHGDNGASARKRYRANMKRTAFSVCILQSGIGDLDRLLSAKDAAKGSSGEWVENRIPCNSPRMRVARRT